MILGPSGLLWIQSGGDLATVGLVRTLCGHCAARGKNPGCVFRKAMAPPPSANLRSNHHRSNASAWWNDSFLCLITTSVRLRWKLNDIAPHITKEQQETNPIIINIITKAKASLDKTKAFVKKQDCTETVLDGQMFSPMPRLPETTPGYIRARAKCAEFAMWNNGSSGKTEIYRIQPHTMFHHLVPPTLRTPTLCTPTVCGGGAGPRTRWEKVWTNWRMAMSPFKLRSHWRVLHTAESKNLNGKPD